MERTSALGVLALLLCVWTWGQVEGIFNTDTRDPVLRRSPALLNNSHLDKDDFFGFAIALHQLEEAVDGDGVQDTASKIRLIVGAPTGTFPGGLDIPDRGTAALSNTGLVYTCPLVPGSCGAVLGDDDDFDDDNDALHGAGRLFDQRPNALIQNRFGISNPAEQKEGQLLGATVFSQNGTLMVCAPAWTATGRYDPELADGRNVLNVVVDSNALPKGRCYWTNRMLTDVQFLDPCNSPDDMADVREDIEQGYCTTGTGVAIVEPGRFVVGSPGYDRGIGALFYGRNASEIQTRDIADSIGIGNIKHPNSSGDITRIVETAQGFQVITGYITEPRGDPIPPNVLASAYRYDNTLYTGRVDVYDGRESGGNISVLLDVTAEGQQIAEFFGYSLATVDINSDGYDDLLVGAPMYSQIDPSTLKVEIGRVYVFMNTGNGDLSTTPIILAGTVSRGRFGMSVQNLGDIDQDGYEDFAVGAPYERNGDSTGVVYIYYGSNNATAFGLQQPGVISGQSIADNLMDVDNLQTFGFSLASQDVDNNQHSDLAIGAFESGAVVLLRSRPVANVVVSLTSSTPSVRRSERDCDVGKTQYPCFDVTVDLGFTGQGLGEVIEVIVTLREIRSSGEQRIFFGGDTDMTMLTRIVQLNTSFTATVYVLNVIFDSSSNLQLEAEVQQNTLAQPSSPGNGQPDLNDLSQDFIIRQPPTDLAEVELANNCGGDGCNTDYAISTMGDVEYLPDRGLNYESIEVGGVEMVRIDVLLSNNGIEDAIVLELRAEHNVTGVFQDELEINLGGDTFQCARSRCNARELLVGDSVPASITLQVFSDAPLGTVRTSIILFSNDTSDTNLNNNRVDIPLVVERRADLSVSVNFLQDSVTYGDVEPVSVRERSEVGMRVAMEVTVTNVRSSTINNAELTIFYPASSRETGDLFFLLPDCDLTTSSTVTCNASNLINIPNAPPCDGPSVTSSGRRKRHTINPVVRQRWKQPRTARAVKDGLRRRERQDMSSLDCASAPPDQCRQVTCTITQLQGLSANDARVTIRGFVDERFLFDKDVEYVLRAHATVFFDPAAEQAIDQSVAPNMDSAIFTLNPPGSTSSSSTIIIIVIVVVVVGSIAIIIFLAVVLYCCGFFKRKRKPEGDAVPDGVEGTVTVTTTEEKPAGTTL